MKRGHSTIKKFLSEDEVTHSKPKRTKTKGRNDYFRKIAKVKKIKNTSVQTKKHKEKRLEWTKKYLKHIFFKSYLDWRMQDYSQQS